MSRLRPPWRIGVDVGGTYTDLVLVDALGASVVVKVPSVPADPAEAVIRACTACAAETGLTVATLLGEAATFVHGTTIATNTLLTRSGAKVGLVTTAGFRDWLAIRRGMRENPWDHRAPNPEPLVPRHLRLGVGGRLDAQGRERAPLDAAAVAAAATTFRREGVEAVALCLLHAHANPDHEDRAAAILAAALPGIPITRSASLAPVVGEYARGSTAVMNAYLAPRVSTYLRATEARLEQAGLRAPLLLMQSNGGVAPVAALADQPVRLLLSGPAAAIGALARIAAALASPDLVSVEIGGTSCDVALIADGRGEVIGEHVVEGHHVAMPTVDLHTVGAGGGTIARVDGGLLMAGPEGAGADPGPAAYGRGGARPTLTDALLVLGRLAPGAQSGGVTLERAPAVAVVARHLASPLGLSVEAAALGVVAVVEQHLIHAVERLSIERGRDPRRFTLVAAGGAGPMHGVAVARRLGISRVVIPRRAGAFCAAGLLRSDIRRDRRLALALDLGAIAEATAAHRALVEATRDDIARSGIDPEDAAIETRLDLRYAGQQWDVGVQVAAPFDPVAIRRAFEDDHNRLFGHVQPGGAIRATGLTVTAIGRLGFPPVAPTTGDPDPPPAPRTRPVWLGAAGASDVAVYDGADLAPGHRLIGPLLIAEATTTILVDGPDRVTLVDAEHYLVELATRRT